MTVDLRIGLELPVDAAVALFEATGVPGQVEMEQVPAVGLKVETLPGCIGRNEDSERVLRRLFVERGLDGIAVIRASRPVEDGQAFARDLRTAHRCFELVPEVAGGILVFSEQDDAEVAPWR